MRFQPSSAMKISVMPKQEKYLSSKERIEAACTKENVLAFDICLDGLLIGFAMVREFDEGSYFLWNYAIYGGTNTQNIYMKRLDLKKQILLMKAIVMK